MAIAPETVVNPPRLERGRGGLLDTFDPIRPEDAMWRVGFVFQPMGGCLEAISYAPCVPSERQPERADVENPIFIPIEIEGAYTCGTSGFREADYRQHAEFILDKWTSHRLEHELWTGTLAVDNDLPTPFLTNPLSLTTPYDADAIPLPYALARMQRRLRECLGGNRGVIHARSDVVSLWQQSGAVIAAPSGALVDIFGNFIVAGSGYDGSSPYTASGDPLEIDEGSSTIDETEATAWVYGTGLLNVYLDEMVLRPNSMGEAMNRGTNDVTFYADRVAAVSFDPCCHIGINVDLNSTCAPVDGGGG
jgi:hypothetical protein